MTHSKIFIAALGFSLVASSAFAQTAGGTAPQAGVAGPADGPNGGKSTGGGTAMSNTTKSGSMMKSGGSGSMMKAPAGGEKGTATGGNAGGPASKN